MPDDVVETPPVETPPVETEVETPPVETPPVEEEKPPLTVEQLTSEVEKVRREAAGYRTRLRDAEKKLETAKTPDEVEAVVNEFRETNARLEREVIVTRIASKYELPAELTARLVGNDEAALEADAKVLAALVTTNPNPVLKGGLNPADSDDDFDPVKVAHAAKARRY